MSVTDEQLRALVRDAIARHLTPEARVPRSERLSGHASHERLPLPSGSDDDGACLIEPRVRCMHCGYCQSLGH